MTSRDAIEGHYTHGGLIAAITTGLAALGKTPRTVTADDLAPVDEFHTGARQATEHLVDQLPLGPNTHLYDIGSGLGGTARLVSTRFGCRVTGVDLTAEFVEAARTMNGWVGMEDRLAFHHASALDTPFVDAAFDAACMVHVGMNITDKAALFAETARLLKPGAPFGIYDIMAAGTGELAYPVPWATEPGNSALATLEDYQAVLKAVGFEITEVCDRSDFAIDFSRHAREREREKKTAGPPPLGIHIIMGENTGQKIANLAAGLEAGIVAPVEIIARRSG